MKLIVFFGIYIGYLLIASKVFQKFELSEYEKRCTEGAWFEISVNLCRLLRRQLKVRDLEPRKVKERIRRYKAKMAIKTYYGFDYHKKLCGMIGQVVNYRKMAWLILYDSYPLLISSSLNELRSFLKDFRTEQFSIN